MTPVADGLAGDAFWIIIQRNPLADPRVRVKARGRWRTGRARVLSGAGPVRRGSCPARILGRSPV